MNDMAASSQSMCPLAPKPCVTPVGFACCQVAVGVGTLAGSTIMLLTIAWGGSLLAGRCDLNDSVSHRRPNMSYLPSFSLTYLNRAVPRGCCGLGGGAVYVAAIHLPAGVMRQCWKDRADGAFGVRRGWQ